MISVVVIVIVLKLRLSFLVVVQVFMFLTITLGNLRVFVLNQCKEKGRPSSESEHVREPETLVSVDVLSNGVGSFMVNCNGLLDILLCNLTLVD
jgi:hypothetical protein|nr:MAG TPA: hypothetical protein [Caudoviricetes sp.]